MNSLTTNHALMWCSSLVGSHIDYTRGHVCPYFVLISDKQRWTSLYWFFFLLLLTLPAFIENLTVLLILHKSVVRRLVSVSKSVYILFLLTMKIYIYTHIQSCCYKQLKVFSRVTHSGVLRTQPWSEIRKNLFSSTERDSLIIA